MTLRRKLGAAFVAALVIVLGVSALSWLGESLFARTVARVDHTYEVVDALDSVLEDLTDIETGARGFAMTGQDRFLEPYQRGSSQLDVDLAAARALVSDAPSALARLDKLGRIAHERLGQSRTIIDLRRTSGLQGAAAAIAEGRGKDLMDAARDELDALQAEQRQELAAETDNARARSRFALVLIVVSAVAMVLVVVLGLTSVRRTVVRPIAELATAARRAGRGDWRPVVPQRQDEIGELATELARMFDLRQEAEKRLRELIADAPIPFFLADLDGRYVDVNAAACTLLGYTREELVGKTIVDLIQPEDVPRLEASKQAMLVAGAVDVQEWQLRAKSGELVPVEISARILADGRWQALVHDLRDRKRLEEERAETMRVREQLIAVVSHDLKSPLNAIELRATLAARHGDAKVQEHCVSIRRSVAAMQRMIRGLLDASSLEAGKLRLELDDHDLVDIANEVVDTLQPVAVDREVTLICTGTRGTPRRIDRDRIAQVIYNLVGNALKFTPAGGSVTLDVVHEESETRVSVADTGAGIAAEALPRIFDRFYTSGGRLGGTGLGLEIAKGLVEAHGGKIRATSSPGQGSTFTFTIAS